MSKERGKEQHARIWGKRLDQEPDALMLQFCSGRDVAQLPMADEALLPYDLWSNRAHAIMLHRQGILEAPLLAKLLEALKDLEDAWESGRFTLDPAMEDVHINVERFVTERAGPEAGGRLHTGRSRNDQVGCDMRLYLRAALLELGEAVTGLAHALLDQAGEHTRTVMPGFSHHQPAMPTTWGHWLCSYVQALLRDIRRIRFAFDMVNRNPLGAAAAFGTSWPIDRELTTSLLAFETVETNTLDCISSRWEMETQVTQTFAFLMSHLSLISQDLIMLSHPYWGMLTFADAYVTGSSIMPQKRNPDLAETIKGKTAWVGGMAAGLMGIPHGGMSGYNKDTQVTKYAVMDVVRECLPAPTVLRGAFQTLQVHPEVMAEKLRMGFLMATDFADGLARALNLPFRDCYNITSEAVRLSDPSGEITPQAAAQALKAAGHSEAAAAEVLAALSDPLQVVGQRLHSGAPGHFPLRVQVDQFQWELATHTPFIARQQARIDQAYLDCRDYRLP